MTTVQLSSIGHIPERDWPIVRREANYMAVAAVLTDHIPVQIFCDQFSTTVDYAHLLLSLPGEYRKTVPSGAIEEFYFVYSPEMVCRLFGGKSLWDSNCRLLPLADYPEAVETIRLMIRLMPRPLTPSCCSQLDHLALALCASTFWKVTTGELEFATRLNEVEKYCLTNYNKAGLTLEGIAAKFNMSVVALHRLWRTGYSQPLWTTLLQWRNTEALKLLRDRALTVARVAEMTGFADPRYFSRFFHKINGVTPTEYRMRLRNEQGNADA